MTTTHPEVVAVRLLAINVALAEASAVITRCRKSLLELPQCGRVAIAGMHLAAAQDGVEDAQYQLKLERKDSQ